MTQPQHVTALNRANRVRLRRARDKRDILALPRPEAMGVCADILEALPDHWGNATPLELLMAVKRVGRFYALSILRRAGVSESRRLCELTVRQRGVLADVLRAGERAAA